MTVDLGDAAKLVRYGFEPKLLPARDPEYLRLVRAYQSNAALQDATEQIALGLGLSILAVHPQTGVVAWAEAGSPFGTSVGTFLRQARSEQQWSQRITFGVALLATWRLCYPQPAHLDDAERVARVSVDEVVAFVDGLCDRLDQEAAASEEEVDPPVDQPGLERAWRAWSRRGRAARTPEGRRSARTTPGIVSRALDWMADQGLADKVSDAEGGTFRARARLRVLVRELAAGELYAEVLRLAAELEP